MSNSQQIPWKRLFVEAAAIVASILLAFAIDAWWENRQEGYSDFSHLAAVASELRKQRELLDESIAAHQVTITAGRELLDYIASEGTYEPKNGVTVTLSRLVRFYQINAPFGALETAMLAGAIPRMRDSELATSLANWPIAIEDLQEEQTEGFRVMFDLLSTLSERTPMAAVYGETLSRQTIRGTSEVVNVQTFEPGDSLFKFNPESMHQDHEVESALLVLLVLAQSALAEATIFADMLDELIDQLDTCLQETRC